LKPKNHPTEEIEQLQQLLDDESAASVAEVVRLLIRILTKLHIVMNAPMNTDLVEQWAQWMLHSGWQAAIVAVAAMIRAARSWGDVSVRRCGSLCCVWHF
jgi:hypothetical protein